MLAFHETRYLVVVESGKCLEFRKITQAGTQS